MSESKYDINEAYLPLYTSKKRYFLITGGRGSLKSHSVHDFILRLSFEKGQNILFTRYTMTSAEISIIPDFQNAIERLEMHKYFHVTKKEIINTVTGAVIYFRGIKTSSGFQTANLKSLPGITTWVVEEAEDFQDESVFEKIDDSIRTQNIQNRVILVMNPTTREHFLYNKFFEGNSDFTKIDGFDIEVSKHPKLEHIHTTYHIGKKYLAKDWLEKAKHWYLKAKKGFDNIRNKEIEGVERERAIRYYINNYLGGWRTVQEGVVFTNWEVGEFDTSLPFVFGQDFGGTSPSTLVKVAINRKDRILYVKECFYEKNLNINQLFEKNLYFADKKTIIADSAAKSTIITLANMKVNGKYLNIEPCRKWQGSVLDTILRLQSYQIIVDKDSTNLIMELNNYVWLDNGKENPIDAYNHLIDPIRYCLVYLEY